MSSRRRNEIPRPFLKWAGGKTQLLGQFEALYPPRALVKRYLEPFLGSGAVFFQVKRLLAPRDIQLADRNEDLVQVYRAVQEQVDEVIGQLHRHVRQHSKHYYYRVRGQDLRRMSPAAKAARLIYLNKTCFNGLYRVNSRGHFNVPMGNYRHPAILDEANLRGVSESLQGVMIRPAHFRDILVEARAGDFIYFDPPYDPLSSTSSFTAYTSATFGQREQEELAAVYAALHRRGCRVMLSNSDTPLIRRLYRGFDLRTVSARRSINSKADRRGAITEIVALNYEPSESTAREIPLETQSGGTLPLRAGKPTGRSMKSRRARTAVRP